MIALAITQYIACSTVKEYQVVNSGREVCAPIYTISSIGIVVGNVGYIDASSTRIGGIVDIDSMYVQYVLNGNNV